MGTPAQLNPDDLKRDWIVGVPGRLFQQRVERRLQRIRDCGESERSRGVLVAEADPVKFVAALLAAVVEGVPVVLGNPRWGKNEWEELSRVFRPTVVFGKDRTGNADREDIAAPPAGAILVPTGGSSGSVRLAVHDWQSLSAAVDGLLSFFGPGPVNCCCVLPLFHVSGLMQVVRSLVTGGEIAFPGFAELQRGKFPRFPSGTMCISLVPTQLQRLIAQKRIANRLAGARAIFLGGAPTPDSHLQKARTLSLPLIMSYGMTETAAMITALPPDEFLAGQMNAGRPLSHAKVTVVDADGNPCGVNESGRIAVAGPSLFKGYLGAGRLRTMRRHLTDDDGFFDSLGRLHIIGRRDRIVITRGEKVDPLEVEDVLRETGSLKEVLVMGWPHPEWGQQLIAFYEPAGIKTDLGFWEKEIRSDLAHFKVPQLMIEVDRLPLNAHGKIDRQRVAALMSSHVRKLEN